MDTNVGTIQSDYTEERINQFYENTFKKDEINRSNLKVINENSSDKVISEGTEALPLKTSKNEMNISPDKNKQENNI